jgi:hypothetical protein
MSNFSIMREGDVPAVFIVAEVLHMQCALECLKAAGNRMESGTGSSYRRRAMRIGNFRVGKNPY